MSETPRNYESGNVYGVCFRARTGLPFPALGIVKLLLKSVLARVQRDQKVHLCHYLWMGNHPHFVIVVKDAEACVRFYSEVMRQITELLKRLLGLDFLHLWEERPNVSLYPNLHSVIVEIAYLYNNPTDGDLVNTIEEYPGLSSFAEFTAADSTVAATCQQKVPWIRAKTVEKLHSATLSERSDAFLTNALIGKAKKSHTLIIEPNRWMRCFKITDGEEVRETNQKIMTQIRAMEQTFVERRMKEGKTVLGIVRLRKQAIFADHTPLRSKEDRKVFVICYDKPLRDKIIAEMRELKELLRELYFEWKAGDFSRAWPPGTFRPPMMHMANAI